MNGQNQQVTEERRTTTFVDQGKAIWSDFGPFIVGIMVLLLVLGGVWYLWSKRSEIRNAADTTVVLDQNTPEGTVPLSQVTLGGTESTPTPSPIASPSVTPTPKVVAGTFTKGDATNSAATKGGQLPKTGFPELALGFGSLATLASGIYLRRKVA